MSLAIRVRRGLVAASLAFALTVIAAPSAAAECDGPAISFRTNAPSAPTVVIGEVTAVDSNRIYPDDSDPGRASAFSLAVRHVLRGTPAQSLQLEDVRSGPCSGPVTVRVGERIAIAFGLSDRLLFGDATWSAVAWIKGTPPRLPDLEVLTDAEAFRALGLEPPDTSAASPETATIPIGPLFVVALVCLAMLLRRRPAPGRDPGD